MFGVLISCHSPSKVPTRRPAPGARQHHPLYDVPRKGISLAFHYSLLLLTSILSSTDHNTRIDITLATRTCRLECENPSPSVSRDFVELTTWKNSTARATSRLEWWVVRKHRAKSSGEEGA